MESAGGMLSSATAPAGVREGRKVISFRTSTMNRLWKLAARRFSGAVVGVRTAGKVAALTFDDGPHPEYTPRLLEILDRHDAKGTFFVLGEMASRHGGELAEIARRGHAIGNHTWNHPSFPRISSGERRRQIKACAAAIAPHDCRLFRPPYGHMTFAAGFDARYLGYTVVTWSAHVEDWLRQPVDDLANRLLSKISAGGIVLLHDCIYDVRDRRDVSRDFMLIALDLALERLRGEFQFVTVPELLTLGRPRYKYWRKQGGADWIAAANTGCGNTIKRRAFNDE